MRTDRQRSCSWLATQREGPDSGTIGARSKIQILDENGVDVTPKSMLHLKASTAVEDGVQGTPGTSNPASEVRSHALPGEVLYFHPYSLFHI